MLSALSLVLLVGACVAMLVYELRGSAAPQVWVRGPRWELEFGRDRAWVDNDPQRRLDRDRAVPLARQRLEDAHRAHLAAAERRNLQRTAQGNPRDAYRAAAAARSAARAAYFDSQSLNSPAISYGVRYTTVARLAAVLPLAWLAGAAVRRGRCRHNKSLGICRCGYDLRATPGRCPECGTVAAADGEVPRPAWRTGNVAPLSGP